MRGHDPCVATTQVKEENMAELRKTLMGPFSDHNPPPPSE